MDSITLQRIGLLHPAIREKVAQCIKDCDAALTGDAKVRIVQGMRTFEEQAALYAQGRTKPGKIVTNAKAGQSFHNYGLAIDYCLIIGGGTVSWDMVKDYDHDKLSDWKEVYNVFKRYGFESGADWHSFKDYPHMEMRFGFTESQLLARYNVKQFVPGTHYVTLTK